MHHCSTAVRIETGVRPTEQKIANLEHKCFSDKPSCKCYHGQVTVQPTPDYVFNPATRMLCPTYQFFVFSIIIRVVQDGNGNLEKRLKTLKNYIFWSNNAIFHVVSLLNLLFPLAQP